jgi:hypothetical protein
MAVTPLWCRAVRARSQEARVPRINLASPMAMAGGKNSHVRVQRVDKPGATETETRLWGSYERVSVKRA